VATSDRIRDVVAPVVAELELELYDVDFSGGLLRVTLDRPGGIDLDLLTEANRRISRELDLADPVPGRYTLEVTSPGLERNLRTPAHFERAVGELVRIKTAPSAEGDRRVDGLLVGAAEGAVVVRLDDGSTRTVRIDEIERARTRFEWGPTPKPGSGAKAAARTGGAARPDRPSPVDAPAPPTESEAS